MNTALVLLSLAVVALPVQGADPLAQYDAVKALGTLNGVALYCKSLDQTRRMKEAVVTNAPKERSFGLAFDEATDEAFRTAVAKREPCPSPAEFAQQVSAGIEALRQAFGRP